MIPICVKNPLTDAIDEQWQTPLHCASFIGNSDVAVILLNNGADVTAKDCTGTTPLHLSVSSHCFISFFSVIFKI